MKGIRQKAGGSGAGLRPAKKNVITQQPVSYKDARVRQLLVHFSNALLSTAKRKLADDFKVVEVQTMSVNGHALVSANMPTTRDKLEKALTDPKGLEAAITEIAGQYQRLTKVTGTELDGRHAKKLLDVLQGKRLAPAAIDQQNAATPDELDAVRLATLLRRTIMENPPVVRKSALDAAQLIADNNGERKIVIVDGPFPHA